MRVRVRSSLRPFRSRRSSPSARGEIPATPGGPDISQVGGELRSPDRRPHRRDRRVLAVASGTGAGAQPRELLQLRRQLGHHRHLGDALRHPRSAAGDGVRVAVRADPGDAGGPGGRDLRHPVRAAAGCRATGLHGRSAGRGALDHLRRLGLYTYWRRSCDQSRPGSTTPWAGASCSPPATRRWPAAAPSSPAGSCWR